MPGRLGEVMLVDAIRSPFGQRDGQLADWHPSSIAAITLGGLLQRADLKASAIDSVLLGCSYPVGAQSMNIARNAVLAAQWPLTTQATTVNAQDTSSTQALGLAFASVASGLDRMVLVGGVESASHVPPGTATIDRKLGRPFGPDAERRFEDYGGLQPPGDVADGIARHAQLTRQDLETYASESRRRAIVAQKNQLLDNELVPWPATLDQTVFVDELTSSHDVAGLASLEPCFRPDGVLTAALLSPAADGAAAVLLADAKAASSAGLDARARILGITTAGNDIVGHSPFSVQATTQLLDQCSLSLNDIDIFEVHEPFASIPLAWAQSFGVDLEQINLDGGALAFGDPAGASPIKLLVSALNQLERRSLRYALVACGGTQGHHSTILIERLR